MGRTTTSLWHRSSRLADFEATMSGLLRPCAVHGRASARYRTEIRHGRLSHLSLTVVSLGDDADVTVDPHHELTLLQIPLDGAFASVEGRDSVVYAAGQQAQLVAARSSMRLSFGPATRMLIVELNPGALSQLAADFGLTAERLSDRRLSLRSPEGAAMQRLATFMASEIAADPQPLTHHAIGAHLERSLAAAISCALDAGEPGEAPRTAAAPYYVLRAERYLRENLAEEITLADLAAASGASLRSLHRGFRSVHGISPLTFLKNLRLEEAHRALTTGRVHPGRITEVATSLGFNHLGLFAAQYCARFGCTPSETLRRRRN